MTVASQPTTLDTLITQYTTVYHVVRANTQGLSHEESLVQPEPAGNCLNWVMGHLMTGRNGALQLLGKEPLWTEEESAPYKRHGPPLTDPANALPIQKILDDFERSQELIVDGLKSFPAERLTQKAPFSPTNNPEETFGSLLATMVFHDAYHTGQTGLLRRIANKEGAIS